MRGFAVRGARRSGGFPADNWRTSSFSGYTNECIEVAGQGGTPVRVRDSKDRGGAILDFTPAKWDAFLGEVRSGRGASGLR